MNIAATVKGWLIQHLTPSAPGRLVPHNENLRPLAPGDFNAALLGPQWKTLPGNVIELGASGWQIRIATRKHANLGTFTGYEALSPEGDAVAWTHQSLQELKRDVEQWARNRKEFQV